MNLPNNSGYSPGQMPGDGAQGVRLVMARRASVPTTTFAGQMQHLPIHWIVSPAQQSPVSPMEVYDGGWAAREQRMHAIRSGYFNPMPMQSSANNVPALLRQRQRVIQSIPPPPIFSEPSHHSQASLNNSDSSIVFFHQEDPRIAFAATSQVQQSMPMPHGDYATMQFMRRSSAPNFSPSVATPAHFPEGARFSLPSSQSIPTRLHNLQVEGMRPKPVSPINPRLFFPASFYPSSRDVVIEWCFDDERATSFPGKNGQFEALLAASYPSFVACRSKGQLSALIDAIVDTIIRNCGQFVTPERVNGNVLWKRAEPDMARAFCMHRLQLWTQSQEARQRSNPASRRGARRGTEEQPIQGQKRSSCEEAVESDGDAQTGLINVKFKRPRKRSNSA